MDSIAPSPNRADPPRFHRMSADAFEQMCRALLDKDEGVRLPDLYHTPRQPQFGVDIDGERADGSGIDVISCKCYEKVRKGQLAEWSNDFLECWDSHWKRKRVLRFILAVAAPLHSKQRRAEVAAERDRFERIQVKYEVWAPHQLQEKLRGHPGIVSQYLGSEWVPRLCGRVQEGVAQPMLDAAVVGQIATVQAALAVEIEAGIEAAEASSRQGDAAAIDRALDALSSDPNRWRVLPPKAKARLLRLRATRRLAQGDLAAAVDLADKADRLTDPEDGKRLRALITFRQAGPAAGLSTIGEPTSASERQLKAALLLAGGRPDEALRELVAEDTAEDWRLRALALATLGKTADALEAVRAAESLAPDWLMVRRAGTMVRYGAAMSPGIAFEPNAWPNPVARDLVREDDEGRGLLAEAAAVANTALCTRGLDADDRHDIETWRLACLANLRERSTEAEAYARSLLAGGRAHPGAVVWSLARGFEFDRGRAARALENLLAAGRGDLNHLIALAVIHLEAERPDKARRDLERYGERYSAGPVAEHLDRWRRIVATRSSVEASIADDLPWERLRRLIQEAERTGDWGPMASFATAAQELSLAEEGPALTFGAAIALTAAGRWDLASPLAAFLVEHVATAAAVRLAAIAAFETGDHGRALDILDEHTACFPHGELPLELRRLHARCLDLSGRLPEAVRVAERVASSTDELPDILAVAKMRIAMGDLIGALPQFRAVAARDELQPQEALGIAEVVRLSDPELANELLRKAQQTGVPEQLAALEARLAYSLSLDAEAGPALTKLGQQASHGPSASVRMMTLDELTEFLRRQREQIEQVERAYRKGEVPLHLLTAATGTNLFDLYDRAFNGHGPPLLVHHGRRGISSAAEPFNPGWQLQLDITAILMAWHLDLLDLLEAEFAPLSIPRSLPAALIEMEERLWPHQPSRLAALRAVLAAVDQRRVCLACLDPEEIPAIDRLMSERDGFLVDHEGPRSAQFSQLAGRTVNLRRVIDAVTTCSALASGALGRGTEGVGSCARQEPLGPEPRPGQALLFAGNTIAVFAMAGLLARLLGEFEVFADQRWVEMARAELQAAERGESTAKRIARLRQRIAAGIDRGIYRVLPLSDPVAANSAEDEHGQDATERCLSELLAAAGGRDVGVWIDDRVCSRFETADERPIVGVIEVLSALRSRAALDDDAYFDRLRRLRAARFHFIPIIEGEVLHHLRQAPIVRGELVATLGLRELRRSHAEALLLEDHLQIDPTDKSHEDRRDEAPFLKQSFFLAKRIILLTWQDEDADDAKRRLRSDWIYENLAVDRCARVPFNGDEADKRRLFTFSLAGLVTNSLQVTDERRRAYLDWLDTRVLHPRFSADPSLATEVAKALKELILSVFEDREELQSGQRAEARIGTARLLLELPESIRLQLLEDGEMLATLPLQHRPIVSFRNEEWRADEFFSAAAQALKYGRAEIPPDGRGVRLVFERGDEPGPVLHLSNGTCGVLADPALNLLDEDVSKRRACLTQHPDWIDRPGSEAQARQAEIAVLPSGAQRMQALDQERSASAVFGYGALAAALDGRLQSIPRDLFEPKPVEALIRHLRLQSETRGTFADALSQGASQLVRDLGPLEALERLAGLPVEMPSLVGAELNRMAVTERHGILLAFAERAASPLRRAHAVALLRRYAADEKRLSESLGRLLDDGRQRIEALIAVLAWAERVFEYRDTWRALKPDLRLALVWAHADRITQLLLEAGAPPDFIVREIGNWDSRDFVRWLYCDPAEGNDSASPARQHTPALWFRLLGYALGEEAETRLAAQHRMAVRAAVAIDAGEEGLHPNGFLVARWAGGDAMGSFLAKTWPALARAIDERGLGERLTPEFTGRIVDQTLAAINRGDQGSECFGVLIAAREAGTFSAEDPRLLELLTRVDLSGIVTSDEQFGLSIAVWVAGVARASRDAPLEKAIEQAVATAARGLAERYPSPLHFRRKNDPAWRAVACVVEAATTLCRAARPDEAAGRLVDIVPRIVAAWPATASLWRDVLEVVVRELPFEAVAPLWRLLMELRARDE